MTEKSCHHLIFLTSDLAGTLLVELSPPTPNFNVETDFFFLLALAPSLSTLKFGGAGAKGSRRLKLRISHC